MRFLWLLIGIFLRGSSARSTHTLGHGLSAQCRVLVDFQPASSAATSSLSLSHSLSLSLSLSPPSLSRPLHDRFLERPLRGLPSLPAAVPCSHSLASPLPLAFADAAAFLALAGGAPLPEESR